MVDAELLLLNWLEDLLYETPVYVDQIPDDPSWPLVRITLMPSRPSENLPVVWLVKAWFQIDVYGGTKAQAQFIAEEIVEGLPSIVGAHAEGVVTGSETQSYRSLPDVTYRPPRPRYVITQYLSVHP